MIRFAERPILSGPLASRHAWLGHPEEAFATLGRQGFTEYQPLAE